MSKKKNKLESVIARGEVCADYYDKEEGTHRYHIHGIPDIEAKTYSTHS